MKLETPRVVRITPTELTRLGKTDLSDHLERSRLLLFPTSPIARPSADDVRFLRDETPRYHKKKNVSFYPEVGRVVGLGGPASVQERAARILEAHHGRVEAFLESVLPTFRTGWTSGTSSLRAFEERGRRIDKRKASELVHIDAGAYGATHGALILRFFTNLDENERVWRIKGTVGSLVQKYGDDAGIGRAELLDERPLDRVRKHVIRGLSTLTPMARSLDSSPYDRAMRRLHNYMKESDTFQASPEGAVEVRFPPGSSWIVFADMTGHACTRGRLMIVDTFLIPRENFRRAELTPYEELRSFARAHAGAL